jgi:signal recognition particle subunit SRP72
LQTEQYGAALNLVEALDEEHGHDFGRAYSLYRLQREDEAQLALKKLLDEDDRGALHLEAQLVSARPFCTDHTITQRVQNYRQGQYQSTFDLYNQLLDSAEPVRHSWPSHSLC